jgi:hypothetical protein
MKQKFQGWVSVANRLLALAKGESATRLNAGQRASLHAISERIQKNGIVIADEVGMGKTRIAVELAHAVTESGGRVVILVPPGLGYQWQAELRDGKVYAPPILRSLSAYLDAWKPASSEEPWFDRPVVVISHAFTNWRLGEDASPWRWALLPELYARWRKQVEGRVPRGYLRNENLTDERVANAAASICASIPKDGKSKSWQLIGELSQYTPWPGALDGSEYSWNQDLRPLLEQAVGLGLGIFDLIIIDEAHKTQAARVKVRGWGWRPFFFRRSPTRRRASAAWAGGSWRPCRYPSSQAFRRGSRTWTGRQNSGGRHLREGPGDLDRFLPIDLVEVQAVGVITHDQAHPAIGLVDPHADLVIAAIQNHHVAVLQRRRDSGVPQRARRSPPPAPSASSPSRSSHASRYSVPVAPGSAPSSHPRSGSASDPRAAVGRLRPSSDRARLHPRPTGLQPSMNRRVADPFFQQREVPRHLPQHCVEAAVTHHHPQQLLGLLIFRARQKALNSIANSRKSAGSSCKKVVKGRFIASKWQAHRDRSSDGERGVRNLEPAILLHFFQYVIP